MGHRANYVLIENDQPQIYFSRFGAMYIAETLLGGPDATKTFTCQLTRSDSLLDDIDGEGGVLL